MPGYGNAPETSDTDAILGAADLRRHNAKTIRDAAAIIQNSQFYEIFARHGKKDSSPQGFQGVERQRSWGDGD